MVDVVVLAGGDGRRLRPYTTVFPKPLMPIGDVPILEILLRRIALAGFTRVNLAVGRLAELIEAYFGDGHRFGVELVYWREDTPLGTVGPLAKMMLAGDHVLVLNGDLFTTLDLGGVVEGHLASAATATVAVLRREIPIDFGVVKLDGERITGFEEKPVLAYDVSMGVYVFGREAVGLVPPDTRYDFPDLLQTLLERGDSVRAHRSDDFWLDIGRQEDYEFAVERFEGSLRAELMGLDG